MTTAIKEEPLPENLRSSIDDLPITKREKEVFRLVVDGFSNAEISSHLDISPHTVKNHLTNIFKKLNVSDRVQAMRCFISVNLNLDGPAFCS